jgi:hypothetical protein
VKFTEDRRRTPSDGNSSLIKTNKNVHSNLKNPNDWLKSLDNGKFSVSQRQGLITCIPKEVKPKHFLKYWRPITLLNVDFKIASACIAKRIKPSTFKSVMGRQYLRKCFGFTSFGMHVINP